MLTSDTYLQVLGFRRCCDEWKTIRMNNQRQHRSNDIARVSQLNISIISSFGITDPTVINIPVYGSIYFGL